MGSGIILAAIAVLLGGLAAYAAGLQSRLSRAREERDRLLAERDRVETYFELAGAMIVMLDPQGHVVRLNRKALDVLGTTLAEVQGADWYERFVPDDTRPAIRERFEHLMSGGRGDEGYAEYELRNACGERRHTTWYRRVLRDEKGRVTGLLSTGFDTTERKDLEEALHALAMQDELTGLYNRRGFRDVAQQYAHVADRMGRTPYVFFLDVDGLKSINDSLGHIAGDRALVSVADSLQRMFRASDVIGRIGGDEFAALALVEHEEDLRALLERLEARTSLSFTYQGQEIQLRLSLGVSPVEHPDRKSIDDALAHADREMYREKVAARAVQDDRT